MSSFPGEIGKLLHFNDYSDYFKFVVVLWGFFLCMVGFFIKNSGEVVNRLYNTSNKIAICCFSSLPRKARCCPYLIVLHYPLPCSQFREQNRSCERGLMG